VSRAEALPKTMRPRRARSSVPSCRSTSSPKARATSRTSDGLTSYRPCATLSALTSAHPFSRSISATRLFPDAMFPVTAMVSMFPSSLRVDPRLADADFRNQGDGQRHRLFHLALDQRGCLRNGGFVDLEHEFVVDLQQHRAGECAVPQFVMQADHGDLDQVRGAALDGRV